jgi:branched-chain amino acid transport system substrate-binding protein
MTLKVSRILGLFTALLVLATGCDDPRPIEIGFIGGLSGRVADLGVAALNGARLAIEAQNRRGGVGGHLIQLTAEDDKQDADTAKGAFDALAARPVEAILGPMTSAMAVVLAPAADQRRLTLLSPTVTTRDLAGQDDYFLRVIADTRQYAEASAKFNWQQRNIKSFVILADQVNRAYTDSWTADFRSVYEALGGKVARVLPYRSGQVGDFALLARQALSVHAEAVLILGNAADAAQLCQQIRLADPHIPLVTSEWAATERFLELGGTAVEGVFTAQFVDRESEQQPYLDFRRLFVERFQQEPGFAGIAGYDAASVLVTALKQRRGGESVRDTVLRVGDFQGLQGPIHIDRFGDSWRPTYITVVKGGKYMRAN